MEVEGSVPTRRVDSVSLTDADVLSRPAYPLLDTMLGSSLYSDRSSSLIFSAVCAISTLVSRLYFSARAMASCSEMGARIASCPSVTRASLSTAKEVVSAFVRGSGLIAQPASIIRRGTAAKAKRRMLKFCPILRVLLSLALVSESLKRLKHTLS